MLAVVCVVGITDSGRNVDDPGLQWLSEEEIKRDGIRVLRPWAGSEALGYTISPHYHLSGGGQLSKQHHNGAAQEQLVHLDRISGVDDCRR